MCAAAVNCMRQRVQGATKTCVTYVSIRFTVILYVITKYNIDCCPRCFSQINKYWSEKDKIELAAFT